MRRVLASSRGWAHYAAEEDARAVGGERERERDRDRDRERDGAGSKRTAGSARQTPRPASEAVVKTEQRDATEDVVMQDAETESLGDDDDIGRREAEQVLLKTEMIELPSQEEIDVLLAGAPLSYAAAAAPWSQSRAPPRRFCDMCGFWGCMVCTVCGTGVCGLRCKVMHDAAEHPHL